VPAKVVQEYPIDDFIIAESPTLLKMYQAAHGKQEIGPLNRCAHAFEAAIGLCKLRWLFRLHHALMSFSGNRCSLHRLLVGVLTDTCSAHRHPHSPLQVYELIVQTMQSRFQQAWPLLLAYVGTYNLDLPMDADILPESMSRYAARPFTASYGGEETDGHPTPYHEPVYHHKNYLGKDIAKDSAESSAFLWQVIDDTFIAWVVQSNSSLLTAEAVWQELEFYGVPRPAVHINLEALRAWHQSKHKPGSRDRHIRSAQRQAHHLAVLLEKPALRAQMRITDEEIMELARDIVGHPRTFNEGLRSRVAEVIQGRSEKLSALELDMCAVEIDEGQLSLYLSHCADPRDGGRLTPCQIETLRDTRAPWLHGREQRFLAAAAAWPAKYPNELDHLLSRTTPRAKSSMR
jgi:hypothetical protein